MDGPAERRIVATYRELDPAPALRAYVRAYFLFTPGWQAWRGPRPLAREVLFTPDDSFCSPVFADGHASLVMELGSACRLGEEWTFEAPVRAQVLGALRQVGSAAVSERPDMIGVYLAPGGASALLQLPASELTDRVVNLGDLWGSPNVPLAEDFVELDDAARVDRVESVLLERLRRLDSLGHSSVDVPGLARWVRTHPTSMTATGLADAAGVSRRHLSRVFREVVGVSPKRYCRLARFQAGLRYAGAGAGVRWAQVASELGYADQSHMIAEFRELSSLTPEMLATQRWFHPFILDAQARAR
jgi:AraC-like DNA-binding protein